MSLRTVPNNCPDCGSDNLFSGHFDADDLAVPLNIGDKTPPGVRWTTFCNQCGSEVLASTHRIRHYVYGVPGDRSTLMPRESSMRGAWPSEAKCSCGWETRTGGAVRSWIDKEVKDHKFDVEHGFWVAEVGNQKEASHVGND